MISSPCVKICVVDPDAALCIGCGRTVEEITLWREMTETERVEVMARLPARLSAPRAAALRLRRETAPRP